MVNLVLELNVGARGLTTTSLYLHTNIFSPSLPFNSGEIGLEVTCRQPENCYSMPTSSVIRVIVL